MLHEQVDSFLKHLGGERGLSLHTVQAYGRDVRGFVAFLQGKERIEEQDVTSYLGHLHEEQYASSSVARAFMAIKVFLQFLKKEGIIEQDVGKLLESPKQWQKVPDVLSVHEVEALLSQPKDDEEGMRDRAIIELMYASGLRVSELCDLSLYDIDDSCVKVKGKGGKERLVPVGKRAQEAIDRYLSQVRSQYESKEEIHLFVTKKGKPLHRAWVWKMIKAYAKQAGIQKNIFPHTLRHSFASHILANGGDLRVIQEMLGHSHIATTDRYTHIANAHVMRAFASYHTRYTAEGEEKSAPVTESAS
jgi:integrase/recombinase XerD